MDEPVVPLLQRTVAGLLGWERRGQISMKIISTGIFLFVLVTVAWAQDGATIVTGNEWLKAFGVALATAIMSYGAMHVRVQHLERDLDKKADKATTDQSVKHLEDALAAIRTDMREEMRALRGDLTGLVGQLIDTVQKGQEPQ